MRPLIRHLVNERHLEVIALVITDSDMARGATANTSNMKLLVDLMVLALVYQVLNSGIKIARILLVVHVKGQLGLCKGRVHDTIQEMADASAGVIGGIISLKKRANMDWYAFLWHSTYMVNVNPRFGPL